MKTKAGGKSKSAALNIRIRTMRKSDLPFIHQSVAETNWQDIPPTLKKFAKRDKCDKRVIEEFTSFVKTRKYKFKVYVAEYNNVPVGYISIGELKSHIIDQPFGAFLDFWVEPKYRKKGIGNQLFDCAAKELLVRGYNHWGLMVAASNKASLHMCKKKGFSFDYLGMSRQL